MNYNDIVKAEISLQDTLPFSVSVNSLTSNMGYSTSHIRRSFKQFFGASPGQYRNLLRLERAALMLRFSTVSITTISMLCGYQSHAAFTRAFQNRFGECPKKYRYQNQTKINHESLAYNKLDMFSIRRSPERHYLLSRHYGCDNISNLSDNWTLKEELVNRTNNNIDGRPVWIIHDHPDVTPHHRIRVDMGYELHTPFRWATPLTFREEKLPYVCEAYITTHSPARIGATLEWLLKKALPRRGLSVSGQPCTVTWKKGTPYQESGDVEIELSIPLYHGSNSFMPH